MVILFVFLHVQVTDSVIGVIDNIIEVNSETLEEVPDVQNIIDLLEKQLSNVQKAPGDYHENRDNVAASADKVSRRSLKDGLPYKVSFQGENRKDDDNTFSRTAISIPPSVLDRIPGMNKSYFTCMNKNHTFPVRFPSPFSAFV